MLTWLKLLFTFAKAAPELRHFAPSPNHLLWSHSPYAVGSYARWLTNAIDFGAATQGEKEEAICPKCKRLVGSMIQQHILLQCTDSELHDERQRFLQELTDISATDSGRFSEMTLEQQYAWIIGGACTRNLKTQT